MKVILCEDYVNDSFEYYNYHHKWRLSWLLYANRRPCLAGPRTLLSRVNVCLVKLCWWLYSDEFLFAVSSFRYAEIVQMLSYYSRRSETTGPIKGPLLAWYGLFLLPVLIFPATLLLASCFMNQGPITLIGVLSMLALRVLHSHRMNHVSRWVVLAVWDLTKKLLRLKLVLNFLNVMSDSNLH